MFGFLGHRSLADFAERHGDVAAAGKRDAVATVGKIETHRIVQRGIIGDREVLAIAGEHNQSSVWMLDEGGGSIRKEQSHPTQKPVELFSRPLLNHTRAGEICYVAVERWQNFTGKKAHRKSDGALFDDLRAQRVGAAA